MGHGRRRYADYHPTITRLIKDNDHDPRTNCATHTLAQPRVGRWLTEPLHVCALLQVSFTATPPPAIERSAASRMRTTATPSSKPERGFSLSLTMRTNALNSSVRDISFPYSG